MNLMTKKNGFRLLLSYLPFPLLVQLVAFYKKSKNIIAKINRTHSIQLDKDGIPYVLYGYYRGFYIGKQRSPVAISQKALEYYENFKKYNKIEDKKSLLNCVKWILENGKKNNDCVFLEYDFPWPMYDLEKPWRSGMAQGLAIQALVKAHKISKEKKFLDYAKLLLDSFYVDVKDGGITLKNNEGWWYEEFASKNAKMSKVLNGMMFALLGIYDYYNYTNDEKAKFLFEKGCSGLIKELPKFDYDGFSFYDLLGNPAHKYHQIHIELLEKLYNITKEKIFKEYSDKWKKTSYYQFVAMRLKSRN